MNSKTMDGIRQSRIRFEAALEVDKTLKSWEYSALVTLIDMLQAIIDANSDTQHPEEIRTD